MTDDVERNHAETDIAIVGMAGRFPGARTPAELWSNVRRGVESIRPVSDDELRAGGVDPALFQRPDYVKVASPLDDMELFDSGFFGFSPRDADIMDPQHRHFLECAWEALEDAGHMPESFAGSIGVFGGCGMNGYFMFNLLTNPSLVSNVGLFLLRHTGNDKDFLTTRVSYLLNLTGPSLGVQTACSTSLVAIHVAAQHLLSGECDLALAGGVTIELPHRVGYLYQEGEILSPDGHCRSFDASSKGTVFGSGVGVVALRRLSDALRDGDVIHAIIKGSAVNNDGATKIGYLAPSVDGQASSILEALSVAGVNAASVSYVETHGTGTPVGDPIEIAALTQAFRAHTPRSGFCAIGSLKSNIGHLDTAAGVASLIKVVQALKHREIPPSLHFDKPNPSIDFAATPFWVNTQLRSWTPPPGAPRLAGVSSLGVGGTNAHVILEEPPPSKPAAAARPYNVLLLSARTATSLDAFTSKLAQHFADGARAGSAGTDVAGADGVNVTDAAYMLAVGRRAFEERRVVVCRDAADAVEALTALDSSRALTGSRGTVTPSVVMLFPGGGAQHPDMARDLYRDEPVFKKEVDRCLAICERLGHGHLRDLMYPAEGDRDRAAKELAEKELQRPANSVLSVFVIEYALATLWMSWGVKPAAMIGHSLGEYVAACLAGVMSLQDALALVSTRGRLFERVPEGAMLSVALPEQELAALPAMSGLAIAAVNAPELAVASGPVASIDALAADLATRGIDARRLHINVAAHSPMLDAIVGEFEAFANTIRFRPPTLPYISNVTGDWADPATVTTGKYWASHLRSTVRFSAGVTTLLAERGRVFLEVGPGQTLSSLTRMHRGPDGAAPVVAASLRHSQDPVSDHQPLHLALGRLWMQGCTIDWTAYFGNDRRRVSLPTYAFDRKRHWIAPGTGSYQAGAGVHDAGAPAALSSEPRGLERVTDVSDWAHAPVWKPAARPTATPLREHAHTWLVFADAETKAGAGARTNTVDRFGGDIVSRLTTQRQRVIVVFSGDSYARAADGTYRVRPDEREDYVSLVKDLTAREALPDRVLHLWLARGTNAASAAMRADARQVLGFGSLMAFTQALGEQDPEHALHLTIVTRGAARVKDEAIAYPEDATVLGPVRVIPREYPGLQYQAVDLAISEEARGDAKAVADLAARVIEQAAAATSDPLVALREDGPWTPEYQRVKLPAHASAGSGTGAVSSGPTLRDGGVYVITGGTGGIGQVLATHLAGQHRAKLALIARTPLPETSPFLQSLKDAGATVLPIAADVTNAEAMRAAIARVRDTFGVINGVFHAAGVVDDGLVQMKERESAARVMAPKVAGTLALDAALEGVPLDFFVLFSSTSASLGFVGQADYSAANAFLNAFARSRSGRTIAINWGIWQEVGMTSRLGGASSASSSSVESVAGTASVTPSAPIHPLLGARVSSSADRVIYEAEYTSSTPWVLDEHRLNSGLAIVPGTAFIEMALSAWADMTGDARVQIDDLLFLAPLEVPDGATRRVRHTLQREDGGAWRFLTESAPSGKSVSDDDWLEQARATLTPLDEATLAASASYSSTASSASSTLGVSGKYALDTIRVLATEAVTPGSGASRDVWTKQGRHLRFGPRWNTLRSLHIGTGVAVATLSLDESYRADLDEYGAHPALLDFATASGLAALPRYEDTDDVFVPFSYKRVRISPLPATVTAVARVSADSDATHDAVVLDVDILNEQGEVVAAIEEFTMRRLSPARLEAAEVARAAAEANAASRRASAAAKTPLETLVGLGIRPAEGMEALTRALDARLGPEVVLSSIDLAPLVAFVDRAYPRGRITSARDASSAAAASAASGDMNETERAIAEMWRDLLGADRIGLDDDFFALGGHSLIAVRLASRIEKQFKSSMRLSVLFEAPTVRKLAALVRQGKPAAQWQALTPMRTVGSKPPLFCVHGVGGEVLSYTALVAALDPERPFYGFRAPGHDGEDEPMKDIPSQAALYVKELRAFRPEGPYYLAGYSHGGRVAFEMAQQLLAEGHQVAFLGIIDTWPSEDWPRTVAYAGRWLRNLPLWLAHDFAQSSAEANKNRLRRGMRLVNRIARKLTTPFGGTRQERHVADHINISLLPDAIQRSYEANYHAFITYKPAPYDGRATVFRASAQPLLAPLERDHGWGRFVRGGVTVVPISGNHTTILNPPLVRELAAALERALDEAERLSVAAAPAVGTSTAKSPKPGSRKAASLPALP